MWSLWNIVDLALAIAITAMAPWTLYTGGCIGFIVLVVRNSDEKKQAGECVASELRRILGIASSRVILQ